VQTIAVTGATGFVGSQVVRELLSRGYQVRALVRDREKAREVLGTSPSLRCVTGDVTETEPVDELLRGCQACVHLVGIIREVRRLGQTFHRMHVDATRVVVQACQRGGVSRYLHMSALGVRDVGVSAYQKTKFEGEQIVQRSELSWTIFRPGMIHGKDSAFVRMAHDWVTGHAPPFVFMPYFTRGVEDQRVPLGGENTVIPRIAPIAVEDVAMAFANALMNPRTHGEIYNLVGSETLSWPAMLRLMRDATPGAMKIHPFGIPSGLAALQAQAAELVGLGGLLPFDAGMARMGGEDSVSDLTKVREDLGLRPKAFSPVFRAYAAEMH
jgi:uncharacterized protein YbjT (DUF2867 family)